MSVAQYRKILYQISLSNEYVHETKFIVKAITQKCRNKNIYLTFF